MFAALAVVVQLSIVADVPAPVLADARIEVARIFREVGVDLAWTSANGRPLPDAEVVRAIVVGDETGDLRRQPKAVLGAATTTPLGTRIAWVFYRRVEGEANAYGVQVAGVLACAIAHEIGHLLMPERGHAAAGLMRACWNAMDFQRASRGSLRFSAGEGEALRRTLRSQAE